MSIRRSAEEANADDAAAARDAYADEKLGATAVTLSAADSAMILGALDQSFRLLTALNAKSLPYHRRQEISALLMRLAAAIGHFQPGQPPKACGQ